VSFLYPNFLWALLFVSIPIIIHLFNFRRYKVVYFSNLSYLKNIKKETKSKSQLKQLLILLSRIFAIIFLVLAFAQPYKPSNNQTDTSHKAQVAIYIDNSFSMDAQAEAGSLLAMAQNSAFQILKAFPKNTDFFLITNDFDNFHQNAFTHERIFDLITELKTTGKVKNLSQIYTRADDILNRNVNSKLKTNKYLFFISDFQKKITNIDNITENKLIRTYFLPVSAQKNDNLVIDSVYFDAPGRKIGQVENLNIRLANHSAQDYQNISIKLKINDLEKAVTTFSISARSDYTVQLSYTNPNSEVINGKVEITDYPIIFDNTFYFSYMLSQKINVLELYETTENKYLSALFLNNENINLQKSDVYKTSISEFQNYHLIVLSSLKQLSTGLSDALNTFVSSGGTLLIIPSFFSDLHSYNTFLASIQQAQLLSIDTVKVPIKQVNMQSEIYKTAFKQFKSDVKLPDIKKYYKLKDDKNTFHLLSSKNNLVFLTETFFKRGKSYLFAFELSQETGGFVNHKIFVPTIYNIALYSQNTNKIFYTLGEDNLVEIAVPMTEDVDVLHVQNIQKNYDFIPQTIKNSASNLLKIDFHDNIQVADNYVISNKTQIFGTASFNYNRQESVMDFYTEEELMEMVEKFQAENFQVFKSNEQFIEETLKEFSHGSFYWKYFLIFALIFLAFEILLVRIKKPQSV